MAIALSSLSAHRPSSYSFCFLLLTILLLPWYVVRGDIGPVPVTLLELSIGLTVLIWVIEHAWRHQPVHWPSRWWLMGMVIFWLAATVGVFAAPQLRAAFGLYKAYIIEPMLLGIVVIDLLTDRPRRWWILAITLAISSLSVIGLAWLQHFWHWPDFAPAEMRQGRASAMYNTGNAIGLFIGPVMALWLSLLVKLAQQKRWAWVIVLSVWWFTALAAIIFSRSRGAAAGMGVVLLAIGALHIAKRWARTGFCRWWSWLWVGGLVTYVAATLLFMLVLNHPPQVANPYTRPGFSTLTIRQCTWQGTIRLLDGSPLTGAGLSGFPTRYVPHATCDAEPLVDPHNLVLNFWVEVGAVGLLAMFVLLALYGKWLKGVLASPTAWLMGVSCILPIVYWLVHGAVDVPYFKNDLSAEWWVLLALGYTAAGLWGGNRESGIKN